MEIANETAPGGARLGKTSSLGNRDIAQNHLTPQAEKLNEFDAEIALALTASGWRVAAGLLTHAAKCIEAGDFQSAENNRRQAREQFVVATDVFRQFQEARAAEGASLWAEAFR